MNDDILLDILRFQMRDQIERWEFVCFHWHQLISSNTSWSRRLPLRPVVELKIVLEGCNNYVESTELIVQYSGSEKFLYKLRPRDIDFRFLMDPGVERKTRRAINFANLIDPNDIIHELFALWNNCYVRHMELHFRGPLKNLMHHLMSWPNKNDATTSSTNELTSPMVKIGRSQNSKVEMLCLHVLPSYPAKINTNNNSKKSCGSFSYAKLLMEDSRPMLPYDSCETTSLFAFIGQFGMALRPAVYAFFIPNGHLLQLLASLAPIFPQPCCHIDVQINVEENETVEMNGSIRGALINFIFANFQFGESGSCAKENSSPAAAALQWRRIYRPLHDRNGQCSSTGCYEYAFNAFTLHPAPMDADFIEQIIKHFICLNYTDHLIGRRIQLYTGAHIESLADKDFIESDKIAGNFWADNINEKLYAKWLALIASKERLSAAGLPTTICSPRHGEYLVHNGLTGLEMCIQFITHRWPWGCFEKHPPIEHLTHEDYPHKHPCPYAKLFVLELAS